MFGPSCASDALPSSFSFSGLEWPFLLMPLELLNMQFVDISFFKKSTFIKQHFRFVRHGATRRPIFDLNELKSRRESAWRLFFFCVCQSVTSAGHRPPRLLLASEPCDGTALEGSFEIHLLCSYLFCFFFLFALKHFAMLDLCKAWDNGLSLHLQHQSERSEHLTP